MEVGSVSSYASLAASTQVRARPAEQDRQPLQAQQLQQSQQAQQSKSAQALQSARAVTASETTDRARMEAQNNQPSVNTSGQVVGQRINVTA
jgi:hypothetical protein